MSVVIRPATTKDVRIVRELIDTYAPGGRLLSKNTVTLFEDVQEFVVADLDGLLVGCGALHVMWEDLGEVRTVAVLPEHKGVGLGSKILDALMQRACDLGLSRLFCLTFETEFFARHGFEPIGEAPVDASTYAQLLQSGDEGVAEFLDLERVKPNTLGNTRMLKLL
ncbi:MAG: amino-acid N-acetyltransferase [Actinomycetes bacterium]